MKTYQIIIGSPVDYEELIADIVINGKYIARVQQEEGNDKMLLEFFEEPIRERILIRDFICAIEEAEQLLLK
jgi:hypothetical protein